MRTGTATPKRPWSSPAGSSATRAATRPAVRRPRHTAVPSACPSRNSTGPTDACDKARIRDPGACRSVAGKAVRVVGFRPALRAVHGPEKVGEIVRVNLGHVRHGSSGRPVRLPPLIEGGALDSRADVETADIDALPGY